MKKGKLWVVAPVFNDWDSAAELVDTLKSLNTDFFIKIVLVDDASSQYPIAYEKLTKFRSSMKGASVQILMLPRNLGNQGAIVKGLREAWGKASEDDLYKSLYSRILRTPKFINQESVSVVINRTMIIQLI